MADWKKEFREKFGAARTSAENQRDLQLRKNQAVEKNQSTLWSELTDTTSKAVGEINQGMTISGDLLGDHASFLLTFNPAGTKKEIRVEFNPLAHTVHAHGNGMDTTYNIVADDAENVHFVHSGTATDADAIVRTMLSTLLR